MTILNTKEELLSRKPWVDIDRETHISLKNDYIYFQVSKSASSTVKYYLQKMEVENTRRKVKNVNDRSLSPHVWPSQLKEEQFIDLLKCPRIKKVSFVRNPFARILSCYLHRIVAKPESPSNRALSACNKGRAGPDIPFSEFVRVICDQDSVNQERHWRVQYDNVLYDLVDSWHFIGTVESLDNDINRLMALLRSDADDNARKNIDASPMTTSAQEKVKEYYTSELVDRLVDRYEKDFSTFGYGRTL